MLNRTELYYFSPTGGTKEVGEIFCGEISENVKLVDLGEPKSMVEEAQSELIVAAVPVFGGRIPAVAAKKLSELDGRGKKAVTLAVYGTRAYEDALLELNNVLEERGFQIAASAALIARHSIVPEWERADRMRKIGKRLPSSLRKCWKNWKRTAKIL